MQCGTKTSAVGTSLKVIKEPRPTVVGPESQRFDALAFGQQPRR